MYLCALRRAVAGERRRGERQSVVRPLFAQWEGGGRGEGGGERGPALTAAMALDSTNINTVHYSCPSQQALLGSWRETAK